MLYWLIEHLLSRLGFDRLPAPNVVEHLQGIEIAHRGQCSEAPENTLEAIERAASIGAIAVEFDVGRTKDGHFVLMHDLTIDRTTTGQGKLVDLTLNELEQFHIKDRPGTPIPTLEEALCLVAELGLYADVEVKEDVDPVAFADLLTELSNDLDITDKIWVSSFYPQHLYMIRRRLSWLTIALNVSPRPTRNPLINQLLLSDWILSFLGASIIKPYKSLLTRRRWLRWRDHGRMVMVWTVNTAQEKAHASALGVAMITDCVGGTCDARGL